MAIRLGIVGLGKISQDQHLPVVAKNRDFELVAVVSTRRGFGEVPVYKTLDELMASGVKLDAVSLCMPPAPRFDLARLALAAGLHVLIEKPPTPTVGELSALAKFASQQRRILFTTWHSQYNAAVDEARRLLADKSVAKLHVQWREDVRHWHPGQAWIWAPGGFGVFDPGINAFSIVTKILPQPIFVQACRLEIPRNSSTPIAAQIQFKPSWAGSADLTADLDWRQTGEQSWNISIKTTDGLSLDLKKGGSELFVNGRLNVAQPRAEYERIYEHFAELIRNDQAYVDEEPLRLVSDCFMLGERVEVEAFESERGEHENLSRR